MKKKIYIFLVIFLCFLTRIYADKTDTIPPLYTWITPQEFSILTTNSIKLCVDANDETNGKGVESVKFYAHYFDKTCTEVNKQYIGEVKDFPYEYLWDCSHIPDQSLDALFFFVMLSIVQAMYIVSLKGKKKDMD